MHILQIIQDNVKPESTRSDTEKSWSELQNPIIRFFAAWVNETSWNTWKTPDIMDNT